MSEENEVVEKHRIQKKEFGLDVIFRHDYNEVGKELTEYIKKSCDHCAKFIRNVPGGENFKTFLDVGCADNQAIDYFEKLGYNAKGLDLYPSVDDDRIIVDDFYHMSRRKELKKTDVIFINHTLEHSLAPLLLEQVSKIHKKGGVLFIAVPDADYSWAYDITQSTSHWCIFNEGFLRTIVSRYGYEVCVEKKCFRDKCGELFLTGIKRW